MLAGFGLCQCRMVSCESCFECITELGRLRLGHVRWYEFQYFYFCCLFSGCLLRFQIICCCRGLVYPRSERMSVVMVVIYSSICVGVVQCGWVWFVVMRYVVQVVVLGWGWW